ncbi:hypothetical protein P7K49_023478, partial [Saguinus oedipus]
MEGILHGMHPDPQHLLCASESSLMSSMAHILCTHAAASQQGAGHECPAGSCTKRALGKPWEVLAPPVIATMMTLQKSQASHLLPEFQCPCVPHGINQLSVFHSDYEDPDRNVCDPLHFTVFVRTQTGTFVMTLTGTFVI